MAKKRYKADILSKSSIDQLIKDLQAYENDLQRKMQILCQRLANDGVEIAKAYVYGLDAVFTSELYNSIHSQIVSTAKNNMVFMIITNNSHAVFVEYGTGMIGKNEPYPGPFPPGVSWNYATGKTIRQMPDGRYGWFYQRDGQWYFTEGMPSRPFMYMTSLELMQKVVKTAKEVFR